MKLFEGCPVLSVTPLTYLLSYAKHVARSEKQVEDNFQLPNYPTDARAAFH